MFNLDLVQSQSQINQPELSLKTQLGVLQRLPINSSIRQLLSNHQLTIDYNHSYQNQFRLNQKRCDSLRRFYERHCAWYLTFSAFESELQSITYGYGCLVINR